MDRLPTNYKEYIKHDNIDPIRRANFRDKHFVPIRRWCKNRHLNKNHFDILIKLPKYKFNKVANVLDFTNNYSLANVLQIVARLK